jgi:hypothetical protein
VIDDEEPTRPNASTDPTAVVLAQVHSQLCELDRKRLAKLVEAWHASSMNQRVIIEHVAMEFARPSRDT